MAIKQKTMQEKMKTFLPFAPLLDDDFKTLHSDLLTLIREHGIRQINAPPQNIEEWKHFTTLVHDGWKKAQTLIASRILKNLESLASINPSGLKRKRNRLVSQEEKKLHLEVCILRRMLDSIAWTVLHNEHSTIRRLWVKGGQNNFSAKNITDTMPVIDQSNEDRHRMAICADITTFIHACDILLMDTDTGRLSLVEVKSGEKNIAMCEAAEFAVRSQCARYEAFFKAGLGKTDVKHFERAKKQISRTESILQTIKKEGGTDHNTGATITIHPAEHTIDFFSKNIVSCYEKLTSEQRWAIDTIDDCLHIGVYSSPDMAFAGFSPWMDIIHCSSRIYNITDSFFIPLVRPFASLDLPIELLQKILCGDIVVVLCLDLKRFIELGNGMFPNLFRLGGKKESRKAKQEPFGVIFHEDSVLIADTPDGPMNIGTGIIDRIIFDFQTPRSIINGTYALTGSKREQADS